MAPNYLKRVLRFLAEYEALCRKHGLFISTFPEPLHLCDFREATGERDFLESLNELRAGPNGGNDGG